MAMSCKCPKCGGQVQATRVTETYFSFENGKWVDKGCETMAVRYYCENDHPIDSEVVGDTELP